MYSDFNTIKISEFRKNITDLNKSRESNDLNACYNILNILSPDVIFDISHYFDDNEICCLFATYFDNLIIISWYSNDTQNKIIAWNIFKSYHSKIKFSPHHIDRICLNLSFYQDIPQLHEDCKTIAILCYDSGTFVWDNTSLGLNGSEEAVVYISQELVKQGYKVIIFGNPGEKNAARLPFANPQYARASEFITYGQRKKFDVLVIWRQYDNSHLSSYAKKTYLWIHDIISSGNITKQKLIGINGILWLSHYQHFDAIKKCPDIVDFELENNFKIYGNGLMVEQFKNNIAKKKNSCIYASNYIRGLEILLSIWKNIREAVPDAELNIYYGWNTWSYVEDGWIDKMKNKILELEQYGVKEHGSVDHITLAEKFAESEYWLYPCTFPETFCITAIKAQISGAIPIYFKLAALKETVVYGHGVKSGDIECYLKTVIKVMCGKKEDNLDNLDNMKKWVIDNYSWEKIAKEWIKEFEL